MKSVLLQNVTIIDGTGRETQNAMDVLISDGRISALGRSGSLSVEREETEIHTLHGMTLLPGLIDCHVHIFADGGSEGRIRADEPAGLALLRAAYHVRCTLEAGITTVRDLGGQAHMEFALRQAIAAGYCSGPRLVLAGKLLSMTSAGTEAFPGMYREADGADEVRKAAREQLKAGADVIKVMATGAMKTYAAELPAFMAEKERQLGDAPQRSVKAALAAAIPIAMGTDAGVPFVKHGDNAIELVLMVEAGLSPMQAIVASTRNAARALGLQDEIGTIEVGKLADLLVVEGDPLVDIAVLANKERIRMVVQSGRVVVDKL